MPTFLTYFFATPYFSYLAAVIIGGSGFLSFSPYDFWWLAYINLIGLVLIAIQKSRKTALISSFLWGVSFFTIGVNWITVSISQFGGFPLIISYAMVFILASYLALYPLLFTYFIQKFTIQSTIMFPILWILIEFLRGWVLTGFPWLQFGYTQIDGPFAGVAPIFGVNGLNFLVMWLSAIIVSLLKALLDKPKKMNAVVFNTLLLVLITTLSAYTPRQSFSHNSEKPPITVSLAQGNIKQNLKWDPDYAEQTLSIYQKLITQHLVKSDVIVLPEAALPILENALQPFLTTLSTLSTTQNTEIITGTIYKDADTGNIYNSIVVLGNQQYPYALDSINRYNKHHLVPFGEYVPLEKLLRPIGNFFNMPMSSIENGAYLQQPLDAKDYRFASAICYEIILGERVRKSVDDDTDFIVTISNDAWFGDSTGPWQHLQMARMRALELGKIVIRATNTGISAFIDEKGKIIHQAPQFIETTLTETITATTGKTPYSQLGDKPIYILSLVLALLNCLSGLMKRKLKNMAGR